VFVALFVLNFVDYIKKVQINEYVEWDVKTITAADYTIEFDIKPDFYNAFVDQEYQGWKASQSDRGVEYITPQEAFKDWIAHEMERRLDQLPHQDMDDDVTEIKVAKVTMAFNNAEVINLLRERGTIIKSEQWDKQADVEKRINDLKNEKLETITTPCSVFMTFEREEGITRALRFDELIEADPSKADLKNWLGDKEIEIQAASEPSDIIWENRHFTDTQRLYKGILVWTCLGILLFISFVIIYILSTYSNAMLTKFPVMDCASLTEGLAEGELQSSAYIEYTINTELETRAKETSEDLMSTPIIQYAGFVQCFCD